MIIISKLSIFIAVNVVNQLSSTINYNENLGNVSSQYVKKLTLIVGTNIMIKCTENISWNNSTPTTPSTSKPSSYKCIQTNTISNLSNNINIYFQDKVPMIQTGKYFSCDDEKNKEESKQCRKDDELAINEQTDQQNNNQILKLYNKTCTLCYGQNMKYYEDKNLTLTIDYYALIKLNNSYISKTEPSVELIKFYLVIAIITIFVLISFILIFTQCKRRRRTLKKNIEKLNEEFKPFTLDYINALSHKHWNFPENQLKLGKILDSGTYYIVYQATAFGIIDKYISLTVAVKTLKPNIETNNRFTQAFISELESILEIGSHLNVVNLLGTCLLRKTGGLLMIEEYFPAGNVHQYLLDQRDGFVDQLKFLDHNYANVEPLGNSKIDDKMKVPLCTYDLFSWSYQVAKGMEYLASKNIIHGDLAARNIMLAKNKIVKINDFGLKPVIYNNTRSSLMSFEWMAIELISDPFETKHSISTDVWAFGIVLWEFFSLAKPLYSDDDINLFNIYDRLVQGYRLKQPEFANSKIYNVMLACWKTKPEQRPSFTELAERLSDLLKDIIGKRFDDINDMYENFENNSVNNINTTPNILNRLKIVCENHRNAQLNNIEYSGHKNDLFELKLINKGPISNN